MLCPVDCLPASPTIRNEYKAKIIAPRRIGRNSLSSFSAHFPGCEKVCSRQCISLGRPRSNCLSSSNPSNRLRWDHWCVKASDEQRPAQKIQNGLRRQTNAFKERPVMLRGLHEQEPIPVKQICDYRSSEVATLPRALHDLLWAASLDVNKV